MSSSSDAVIYLKMSIRSFLQRPGLGLISSGFRHYSDWKIYNSPEKSSSMERLPWITFSAIDHLKKIVRPEMTVFEYGSGGSTLFWASRVKKIISVEHDKGWFERMRREMSDAVAAKVQYLLIEPVKDAHFGTKNFENPDDYISSGEHFAGKNFEAYVKSIDRYPDSHFDIIVVDGRARPSCIKHSIPKLKRDGWLVVDNS
ncbi:MAG TPA: hypothetical protein VL727_10425, partial [Puia sp.]|nr:hypothetical protein [Puia sp.]